MLDMCSPYCWCGVIHKSNINMIWNSIIFYSRYNLFVTAKICQMSQNAAQRSLFVFVEFYFFGHFPVFYVP